MIYVHLALGELLPVSGDAGEAPHPLRTLLEIQTPVYPSCVVTNRAASGLRRNQPGALPICPATVEVLRQLPLVGVHYESMAYISSAGLEVVAGAAEVEAVRVGGEVPWSDGTAAADSVGVGVK